jgi:hypothetical protein
MKNKPYPALVRTSLLSRETIPLTPFPLFVDIVPVRKTDSATFVSSGWKGSKNCSADSGHCTLQTG